MRTCEVFHVAEVPGAGVATTRSRPDFANKHFREFDAPKERCSGASGMARCDRAGDGA